MVAVHLGRGGLFQLVRMDGRDDGLAVVFVQAGPLERFGFQLHAFGDALPGFGVAAQRAGDDGVERHALAGEILPEAQALPVAEIAQAVVVFSAERGLAVADEVEVSHAAILATRPCR